MPVTTDVHATDGIPIEQAIPTVGTGTWWMTGLFAATSFVGASLLFVVQPLIARMVLPQFGGSATVWSTSSLFFQVVLLVGYLYVHASTRTLGRRTQPLLHLGLLLLPLVALPVVLSGGQPPPDTSPILWLLRTLTLTIGLPFAVVSTTGPLLQRWYSWTVGRRAEDPYFLFATSNLGSFAGLLAYPFLVEPLLSLDQQRTWWSVGYGVFLVLMVACGATAVLTRTPRPDDEAVTGTTSADAGGVGTGEILLWLGLAFLPSTLMLGVTAHISTDVAAIPLLWVVPLAIYLATFVAAFARTTRTVGRGWPRAAAASAVVALMSSMVGGGLPIWVLIAADLTVLVTAAYTAHRLLAARRPSTAHLTLFYIVVAVGGALGGLLNGVVAPILFNGVWEFPLALVLVVALAFPYADGPHRLLLRRYHAAFVVFLEFGVILTALLALTTFGAIGVSKSWWLALLVLPLWAAAGILVARRPLAVLAAGLALALVPTLLAGDVIVRDRSFYGSYTVKDEGGFRVFSHGTTVHGQQALDERRSEPTTYYARNGPVGDVIDLIRPSDVAVVGLGAGTIAAYGAPDRHLTFFEIDPDVVEVASDPDLFTYLSASASDIAFVVGDGRLELENHSGASYDLIVLDAFTSDAIPVHLLTQEAFRSYAEVLAPDGTLLVHVSSRVFDLEPVVAAGADSLGWQAVMGFGHADPMTGATPSEWIAVSPDHDILDSLVEDERWRPVGDRRVSWTDSFSSVLTVLRGP